MKTVFFGGRPPAMNQSRTNDTLLNFSKQFAFPLWPWYLAGTVALAVTNIITLEIPDLSKKVIDGMTSGLDGSDLRVISLGIIGLGILQMVIRALSRILIFWPGRVLETDVKNFYFSRFMKLPQTFFEKFGMGDLISRLSNDVGQLRVFFAFALLQVLNLIFLTLFTVGKMVSVHWQLTALCLLPLGLMVIITRYGVPKMHEFSKENQDATGRLTNRVTEAFVNVHIIQANSAYKSFLKRIEEENQAVYDSNIRLVIIRMVVFPMMTLLTGFSYLVILYYGGMEVTRGRITVGDIMAFNAYIGLLSFPLTALGIVIALYQRAKTATERLSELDGSGLEIGIDAPRSNDAKRIPDPTPLLEVRNLSFAYDGKSEDRPQALKNISFKIYSGKKLGICGPVGSGKSTLFNLIVRIYSPPPGTIFWQGRDVLEINPEQLRCEIGYALQQPHLFSDSIEANLHFGIPGARSPARLEEAARAAQIYDDITSFEKGWKTEIGEKGVRLSGGQKQRLALARLFIRDPEIFLLDDVTSALDHTTEQRIINYIFSTKKSLVIASHRGSAIQFCDEVLLLKNGQIAAQGSYQDLRDRYQDAFLAE
jgi:ATP-binding cassette subfamily B protein